MSAAATTTTTADVLVLPSRFDGWGAVVNEALMVGTPSGRFAELVQALATPLAREAEPLPLLAILIDLLTKPWEVWQNLFRDRVSGAYVLRTHFIKGYRQADGTEAAVVAQVGSGYLEAWAQLPVANSPALARLRQGNLWYGAADAETQ